MRVIMRAGRAIQSFTLPDDGPLFRATWWRIRDAAKAWDCTPSTAKRLIDRHFCEVGRFWVQICTPRGQSLRIVIPAGTARPGSLRGNPHFTETEYQKELCARRWHPDTEPMRSIVSLRTMEARQRRAERRAARQAQAYHAMLRQRLVQQREQYELEYALNRGQRGQHGWP